MAGAKYSPGFDDPSARRGTLRSRSVLGLMVVGVVAGVAALGMTFAAYLNPSLTIDLGSVLALCAQWIGLR